jgi:hypothetical protein
MNPTQEYWELRHKDKIWTASNQYVGTCENPDYPSNSSLVMHIVNMHNSILDQANVQPFCYDTLIGELRENL